LTLGAVANGAADWTGAGFGSIAAPASLFAGTESGSGTLTLGAWTASVTGGAGGTDTLNTSLAVTDLTTTQRTVVRGIEVIDMGSNSLGLPGRQLLLVANPSIGGVVRSYVTVVPAAMLKLSALPGTPAPPQVAALLQLPDVVLV
jgi:hypothetical protein